MIKTMIVRIFGGKNGGMEEENVYERIVHEDKFRFNS